MRERLDHRNVTISELDTIQLVGYLNKSKCILLNILVSNAESDQDSDPYQPSSPSPSPSPQQMKLFSKIGSSVDFDALGVEQGIYRSKESESSSESDEESSPETQIASLTLSQMDAARTSRGAQLI